MVGRFCLSVTLILPLRAGAVKRQSKAVTGVAALAEASLQGARSMVRWLYITLEGGIPVRVGEVCLLTENVERLSAFYIRLLGLGDAGNDPVHRTLMAGETALTVYREPGYRACGGQSIVLAFTVADVDAAYSQLLERNAVVLEPPTDRPWGARNLCVLDADGNRVYLRSYPTQEKREG